MCIQNHIKLLYISCLSVNTAKGKIIHYEIPGKPWDGIGVTCLPYIVESTLALHIIRVNYLPSKRQETY